MTIEQVTSCKLVPVVVLDDVSQAVPTARALLAGGIDVMEITFRTAAARGSIEAVSREVPEMTVGAGTIINIEQLHQAIDAGAKFIVSPGSARALIEEAIKLEVPIIPGAVTPSEIMMGIELGLTVFKFFPAGNYGGLKTIKALCGPFPQIKFIPTGGVSQVNMLEYLADKKILAVGGSWMVTADMIREGRFDEITEKSAQARALVEA